MPMSILAPSALALATLVSPAPQPEDSGTTPGVTFRVYQVEGDIHVIPTLTESQTPNLDQLHPVIDYNGPDFGDLAPPIVATVDAELTIPHAGPYAFRLTSDDGSRLYLDGRLVVDNDGRHSAQAVERRVSCREGIYSLHIDYFDHVGDRVLKLEWQPPGAEDFTLIPTEVLRTENDLTRVTSPGVKRLEDRGRPGDGKPLEAIHPGWTLSTIRPDGFEPMVGAMTFVPDGRLIIGAFHPLQRDDRSLPDIDSKDPDVLHALTNVTTGDPAQVEVSICAEGFYEPTGLCAVGDDLFVAHRKEVTRLRDEDDDGYYETRDTIASGWEGWNYHQFCFGLVERDGLLYTALSTAMAPDGWEGMGTNAAPNGPLRGSILQIDPGSGGGGLDSFRVFAGGTRTPNGLALGPGNSLFYFDNQGTWMPTSVMAEVIDGRFYGHYNRTNPVPMLAERFPDGGHPSDYCDRLRTPAAVYLPQNEVCNSPTQAQLIPDGPFAGQMFMGELTGGGIRRIFLEKVNGRWQGAIFRFTQGLEAGVNRLVWGPDGALYAGGIGALGNWNWKNTKFGLQRLAPNATVVFEMHSVSAAPDGFIVKFTKRVDREWLADPNNYTIRQWRYKPTAAYGGPKVDEERLQVLGAAPAADGLSVRLRIGGLREGSCVYLRTDPTSFDGEQIWSTEAWYTLNVIPTATPPRPATIAGEPIELNATGLGVGVLPPACGVPLISGAAAPALKRTATDALVNDVPLTQDDFTAADSPDYVEAIESGGDLATTTVFADCRIHVEWYCPPGGEGQLAANSGVYLQDRYEIQILGTPAPDPSTEPLAPNDAGAIYNIRAPDVNASTGPGTWQAYDIFFRAPRFSDGVKTHNARLTLYWNGILVHNDVEVPHPTGSRKDRGESAQRATVAQAGPLILQAHASSAEGPVRFRNVWIAPLEAPELKPGPWLDLVAPATSNSAGSPLEGWAIRGGQATFRLEGNEIVGAAKPGTSNTFLVTQRTFRDFELLIDVKQPAVDGARLNSGIQIRSHVEGGLTNRVGAVEGYQVELDPGDRAWTAGLYDEHRRGWLYPLATAPYARRALRPDEWNTLRIECRGNLVRTWLNGVPAASVFDSMTPEGHIALQVHSVAEGQEGLEVRFRNIRLRELGSWP